MICKWFNTTDQTPCVYPGYAESLVPSFSRQRFLSASFSAFRWLSRLLCCSRAFSRSSCLRLVSKFFLLFTWASIKRNIFKSVTSQIRFHDSLQQLIDCHQNRQLHVLTSNIRIIQDAQFGSKLVGLWLISGSDLLLWFKILWKYNNFKLDYTLTSSSNSLVTFSKRMVAALHRIKV